MKSLVLTTVAVIALSTPAGADWQNTKWGMTQQEILALPSVSPLSPADVAGKSFLDGRLRALLHSPYQSGELSFDAIYMFNSSGRLGAVSLELQNGNPDDLRGSLLAKYGKPRENYGNVLWWENGSDELMFSGIGRLTNVLYQPRITATNKGL
jgi:hypothetical protein